MNKRLLFLIILLAAAAGHYSFEMKKKGYTYIDGNNNTYEVTSKFIEYKPVKPENSSSGTYSGGDPKKLGLTKADYEKLESAFKVVLNDKANHIPERNMGCGTLYAGGGKKPVYISMNAKSKAALEGELKLVLFGI